MQAQVLFKELDAGKWRPFYLVVGEEPFQAGEIASRVRGFFVKGETADAFNYEAYDGEHLDVGALRASLDTLPGLFDGPDTLRLVSCTRFDKIAPSSLEALDDYFASPNPTTCFLIFATKTDKRKAWYRHIEEKGGVIEVSEPADREWPRWLAFFERKLEKRIEPEAWERAVENGGRLLAVVWAELQKIATYVGDAPVITAHDVLAFQTAMGGGDVFAFVDDVVALRRYPAMRRFHDLVRGGEAEIKLLSLLVRQFRMLLAYAELSAQGVSDPKTVAARIGMPPFLVGKVRSQAQQHGRVALQGTLERLAECDFLMKTGEGSLFEHFLVPYFGAARS